jgi:nicotinamide-nucleotide amidase
LTLSTESCTGGELAKMITSVSGSSNIFRRHCFLCYRKKIDILKVKKETVEEFTVVSEQVAAEMAERLSETV